MSRLSASGLQNTIHEARVLINYPDACWVARCGFLRRSWLLCSSIVSSFWVAFWRGCFWLLTALPWHLVFLCYGQLAGLYGSLKNKQIQKVEIQKVQD